MKIKYILVVSIISTFISCNNDRTQHKDNFKKNITSIRIDPDKIANLYLSEIIDSLKYIPLETSQNCYLANIDKLIWYKDNFFVLDKSIKTVFCFSQNGKFLYKIRRVGKGPGEYIGISDFLINPFKNTLEILDRNSRKILCYSISNQEFMKDIKINHTVKDFIITNPSSYFLYTMGTDFFGKMNDLNYNLLQIDSYGVKLLGKYFEAYEGSTIFGYSSMLSRVNDTTALFSCFYNDTIYEINKNMVYPKYSIDFGKKMLPVNIAKLGVDQRIEAFNNNSYACHLNTFFETDEILYFQYQFENNTKKVLYYKNRNKILNFNYIINNDIDGIPLGEVKTVNGNNMLFSLSALRVERFIQNDERVDSNIKYLLGNINSSNNPILVIGKLK